MTKRRHRGRPKGPRKISVHVRILPSEKRDLDLLSEVLEGRPTLAGLVQEAVRQYVRRKLEDPLIRTEFERRLRPSLRVMRVGRHG
jgi:hypothetical protein